MNPSSRKVLGIAALAIAFAAMGALPAPAADVGASPWVKTDHSQVRLVAASSTVGEGETVRLGLHVRLIEGWKIYWRSPGDAGYPPRIDWSGSRNLAAAEFAWPAPQRFSVLGLETIGYKREVVLPIAMRPERPGAPMALRGVVDYLACDDICVPYRAEVALDLDGGPAQPTEFAHLIDRFRARVPGTGGGQGLDVQAVEAAGGGDVIRVRAQSVVPFVAPDVFVEGPDVLAFGAPRRVATGDDRRAILEVPVGGLADLDRPLVGASLTVTVVDEERGAERTLVVGQGVAAGPPSATVSWWVILGLALLGGLILNLMPCVLPVLSLKLLGLAGHGGGEAHSVRFSFLASAAGILFSFMVLATAVAAVKAAGIAVGWGLQFQQPWFLVAMTLVVIAFACNLWGFFEVRLPGVVAEAGAASGRVSGPLGHFLTGALATLLATPCSAPFLGTAIGFALARGTMEIFVVFAALGVGLALPYLAVAAVPRVATMLPRPGPWMVWMKRVLGLALAGTAVWLLTVLAAAADPTTAALVGAVALAMAAVLYLQRPLDRRLGLGGWAAGLGVAALAVVAFAVPTLSADSGRDAQADHDGPWMPLDQRRIGTLVAEGKVVFVNVTADWCITCRVNENLVLDREPVSDRLAAADVVAMRGDWTRPDEAIAHYLASFGRYGIPFDAVYGPGLPQGEALPELLTPDAVTAAIDKAGTGR